MVQINHIYKSDIFIENIIQISIFKQNQCFIITSGYKYPLKNDYAIFK